MNKLTVEKAIRKRFNLSETEFYLSKAEGSWYFVGTATENFQEACAFAVSINQYSLDMWIEIFASKLEELQY